MKKLLALGLALMMCLGCSCMAAGEGSRTITSGDYQYVLLKDDTAKIVGYSGTGNGYLTVTDQLDGHTVTIIGAEAFKQFFGVLILPDSVTTIEEDAFGSSKVGVRVVIPASVKEIQGNPFWDLFKFSQAYVYSNLDELWRFSDDGIYVSSESPYLEVVEGALFSKRDKRLIFCPPMTETFAIPQGTQIIGEKAFCDSNICNVTIPDSVQVIEKSAFESCHWMLTEIIIPDSVQVIGDSAFEGCGKLTGITIPGSVTSIGDNAFSRCNGLTDVTILDGVTSIGEMTFARCGSLNSVTIPGSVISIGEGAFYNCSSLNSVTIPAGVTSIGEASFYRCSSLADVTIPASVTLIGEDAFGDCDENLTITVDQGSYAEQYCKENGLNYQYAE